MPVGIEFLSELKVALLCSLTLVFFCAGRFGQCKRNAFAAIDFVNDACCALTIKLVLRFLENGTNCFDGFVGNSNFLAS